MSQEESSEPQDLVPPCTQTSAQQKPQKAGPALPQLRLTWSVGASHTALLCTRNDGVNPQGHGKEITIAEINMQTSLLTAIWMLNLNEWMDVFIVFKLNTYW